MYSVRKTYYLHALDAFICNTYKCIFIAIFFHIEKMLWLSTWHRTHLVMILLRHSFLKFPRFIFFRAFIIFPHSQIFHLQVMFIPSCLLCATFGPFRFKKQSVCKGDICFCKFKYGELIFTVECNPHAEVERDFSYGNIAEIRAPHCQVVRVNILSGHRSSFVVAIDWARLLLPLRWHPDSSMFSPFFRKMSLCPTSLQSLDRPWIYFQLSRTRVVSTYENWTDRTSSA